MPRAGLDLPFACREGAPRLAGQGWPKAIAARRVSALDREGCTRRRRGPDLHARMGTQSRCSEIDPRKRHKSPQDWCLAVSVSMVLTFTWTLESKFESRSARGNTVILASAASPAVYLSCWTKPTNATCPKPPGTASLSWDKNVRSYIWSPPVDLGVILLPSDTARSASGSIRLPRDCDHWREEESWHSPMRNRRWMRISATY